MHDIQIARTKRISAVTNSLFEGLSSLMHNDSNSSRDQTATEEVFSRRSLRGQGEAEVYQNYLLDSDGAHAKELSRVGVIKKGGNSCLGLRWPHELHTFDKVAKSG